MADAPKSDFLSFITAVARILHLSDLHGHRGHYQWLLSEVHQHRFALDAIALSGDLISDLGTDLTLNAEAKLVSELLLQLPEDIPLVIADGNHDFTADDNHGETPRWIRQLHRQNLSRPPDVVVIDGVAIASVGWGNFPKHSADFYVIHAPPAFARTAAGVERQDFGDLDLADHLQNFGGTALCGHVHQPQKWYDLRNGRRSLNPGISEPEAPTPNHIIIDTQAGTATRYVHGQHPHPIRL